MFGGQWHSCGKCGFAGDSIELAQATWKLSTEATLVKLGQKPDPKLLDIYVNYQRVHRQSYQQFAKSSAQMAARPGPTQVRLLEKARLRWSGMPEKARASIAKVMGVSNQDQVNRHLRPGAFHETQSGAKIEGSRKIFPGTGWTDVITIPLYCVHGRPDAFWIAGRKLNKEDQLICWTPVHSGNYPTGVLGFHADLSPLAEKLIVVTDPLLYLQLQIKYLRTHVKPSPYVLEVPEPTQKHWMMFPQSRKIFWATEPTAELISKAYKLDAQISLAGPRIRTNEELQRWLTDYGPEEIQAKIEQGARSWADILEDHLLNASDKKVEQFALELQALGDLEPMLNKMTYKTREAMAEYVRQADSVRSAYLDSASVTEERGIWIIRRVGSRSQSYVVSDAPFRIEKIITYTDEATYVGTIFYRNEPIPFCVDRDAFEKSPARWIKNYLVQHQKGVARIDKKWDSRLVDIATQFHEPTFVTGVENIGWNHETGVLEFPRFRFGSTDRNETGPAEWFEDRPGACIPAPPAAVDLVKLEELGEDTAANRALWAILLAAISNVLAPGVAQEPLGYVCLGPGSLSIGPAAFRAIGVQGRWNLNAPADVLLDLERNSDWPGWFGCAAIRTEQVRKWANDTMTARNCFTVRRTVDAIGLTATGMWASIKVEADTLKKFDYAAVVFSAYVDDWFARLHAGEVHIDEDWIDWVRADVHKWAERLGVAAPAVLTSATVLYRNEGVVDLWVEAVMEQLHKGPLVMGRAELIDRSYMIRIEDDGIWIPAVPTFMPCETLGDSNAMATWLRRVGALIEIRDNNGRLGYVVDHAWWRKQCQTHMIADKLRVVG